MKFLKALNAALKYANYLDDVVYIVNGFAVLVQSFASGARPNVGPVARRIFKLIPERVGNIALKAPDGPATEQEFVNAFYHVANVFHKPNQ